MFVSVLSAAATWSLISSQLVPVLGFSARFPLRDLREFNLTGLDEHEGRDAHTDKTYTATTEFEYTTEGTSVGRYSSVRRSED